MKSGIQQGGPLGRSRKASQRAEQTRCPKCGRKSALKTEIPPGQVVTFCRWDDCDYERVLTLDA